LADRIMYVDLPPPAALHAGLLDFMRSGDHYRVGYRAAFTMRSDLALRDTRTPVLVTANETDVLAKQLPRIRNVAPSVTVQVGGDVDATHDLCRQFIERHDPPKPKKTVAARALPGRLSARLRDSRRRPAAPPAQRRRHGATRDRAARCARLVRNDDQDRGRLHRADDR
jgi:hypothetical protein